MQIKINSLTTPFIDSTPRFSWIFPEHENSAQKEYTLMLATDEMFEKIIFTYTETTENHANIRVACNLLPHTKYYVRVYAHLENDKVYCASTYFSTGFMNTPWTAKFITGGKAYKRDDILPAIYLRRDFEVEKAKSATLYIVGLGYFEAHINGKKVGNDFLSTPFTAYDKQILYRSFDVTEMIETGKNAIGVILGNGFYNCFTQDPWQTNTAPWRDVPKLMAELHLKYEDHTDVVITDNRWRFIEGPIRFNGIRHGEEYDARWEKNGWDRPDFNGESFPARYAKHPGAALSLMEMEPIRIHKIHTPKLSRKVKNGWLYEFDQNMAGVAQFTFRGKAGTRYTIRYCDRLYADGELDQESLSGFIKNYCFQTDVYTKKSDEPETWNAIFTYHGFQFIEISGMEEPLALEDIKALALCNDFEKRSKFICSDPTVNRIEALCHASTVSCCMNTFVSDAVREKSSWTGDTGLSAEQLLINYNAENLMRKWQQDLRDAQRIGGCVPCIVPSPGWGYNGNLNGPDWSHPMVDVPWNLYTEYGDIEVLRDNYSALCAHVGYICSMAHDYIPNYGLGDWCAPFDGPALSKNMSSFKCPIPVSDTAFFYSAAKMAETCAHLLGYPNDEKTYAALADKIKTAFRTQFFNKDTFTVLGDCQTATALMVYHGLANEDEIPMLVEKLISQIERENGHLDFGVLGCKAVMEVLGRYGKADVGIKMLTNETYPSMKCWLDMGATALLECWNGEGSHNHHMFSSVSAFFHKYVAGLSATAPAYRHIDFRPAINSTLSYAYTEISTPFGKASCGFEKNDGKINIRIKVPASCQGTLHLNGNKQILKAGEHLITVE